MKHLTEPFVLDVRFEVTWRINYCSEIAKKIIHILGS